MKNVTLSPLLNAQKLIEVINGGRSNAPYLAREVLRKVSPAVWNGLTPGERRDEVADLATSADDIGLAHDIVDKVYDRDDRAGAIAIAELIGSL